MFVPLDIFICKLPQKWINLIDSRYDDHFGAATDFSVETEQKVLQALGKTITIQDLYGQDKLETGANPMHVRSPVTTAAK
jgi:hypothetical protein